MEFDYYTAVLYKQFCETKGIEYDLNKAIKKEVDSSIIDEFVKWINRQQVNEYYKYLKSLNYHNMKHAVEINKGKYDTISNIISIPTISPFNYSIGKTNSKLHIVDGIVLFEERGKLFVPNEKKVLITHNPYDLSILKWPMIQKRGEHDISIGFYGLKTDANYKDIKQLTKTLSRNISDCDLDFEFDDDKYYISLNSRSNNLKVLKTRH